MLWAAVPGPATPGPTACHSSFQTRGHASAKPTGARNNPGAHSPRVGQAGGGVTDPGAPPACALGVLGRGAGGGRPVMQLGVVEAPPGRRPLGLSVELPTFSEQAPPGLPAKVADLGGPGGLCSAPAPPPSPWLPSTLPHQQPLQLLAGVSSWLRPPGLDQPPGPWGAASIEGTGVPWVLPGGGAPVWLILDKAVTAPCCL